MTVDLRDTAATQAELIAYLKQHRIWNVETLLWQWLTAHPMPSKKSLQIIQQLKTWLDAFRPLPSVVVSELRQRHQVRFTYHSNALEGNTLTQSETELVLTTGITIGGKTLQEHLEVIGHAEAIAYIEALAQQSTPLGEWEIRQIHSLILRKINPEEAGRYRTLDVQAAGTGYVYPPHYLLSELMTEFVSWLNSEEAQALHPVLCAAEAHHRFVTIHPFRDGNGRAGRLLMNLLLLRSGYPIAIISNENRQRYIEALIQGQQSDNWEPFYALIIDATQTALVEVLGILATAGEIQNKDLPFYQEMLNFLRR
ncbi:Fic family protein [Oscillatoria sp. FACHB-1407]|uniref:Fic family protein n=1 Tax=Oscillatoria sp. FACHB-1407 TaxID=2692847 RepID=UPI00168A0DF4|nr:Fic family protein [Oscillatoria sp. FACHB-1407]MBD2459464.1 Fic family protein [Oscillatoria sp. FACHB-1407]